MSVSFRVLKSLFDVFVGAYRIRPQDVPNGSDFAYPYNWNRNRLPQMSAPPLPSSMYLGA